MDATAHDRLRPHDRQANYVPLAPAGVHSPHGLQGHNGQPPAKDLEEINAVDKSSVYALDGA